MTTMTLPALAPSPPKAGLSSWQLWGMLLVAPYLLVFVAFVLYHEMLHHMMPVERGGGRRELHPLEFREREREFRAFDRAVAWEKRSLSRLLRVGGGMAGDA
jgi:hypothetical protein